LDNTTIHNTLKLNCLKLLRNGIETENRLARTVKQFYSRTLNLEPLNAQSQNLTASALAQVLPSCRQGRGGRIGSMDSICLHDPMGLAT
jgi:hypothetical protein